MKRRTKRFIYNFLLFFFLGILFEFLFWEQQPLLKMIAQKTVWAVIMGLFSTAIESMFIGEILKNKKVKTIEEARMALQVTKTLEGDKNFQEVLAQVQSMKGIKNITSDEAHQNIQFQTRRNFLTWGEEINITITPMALNEFQYTVSSKPRWKKTLEDYGQGKINVRRIKKLLQANEIAHHKMLPA